VFDEIGVFIRGLVIGVMVAAPVGPVGLLCIRRTLQKGLFVGFSTGFGAAFADAFFSFIAVLGVTSVITFINDYKNIIYIIGGIFLLFIAWHTWYDRPKQVDTKEVERKFLSHVKFKFGGAFKSMLTSFIITITNPATLFGILAVIATFSGIKSKVETTAIISGIFCGSSLWWFILSGSVYLMRNKITDERIMIINKITAVILTAIAIVAFGIGIWHFIIGQNIT